jgi:hypothetical protein
MRKDLYLLSTIGAVFAIALSVAAARGALPARHDFNPLANWPWVRSLVAVVLLLAAAGASIVAMGWSDRGLVHPSATLEWVYSSGKAKTIVDDYGTSRSQAIRGVVIDSVAFIPSYVLLIAVAAFSIANGWHAERWAQWTVLAGWLAVFAGALDYVENAGIFAALGGVTTRLAPLTYSACQLKWLVACTAGDFVLIAAIARGIGRITQR